MNEDTFKKSMKITTTLIEQIGESSLHAACAKLSRNDRDKSGERSDSITPSNNLNTSAESNGVDGARADVQVIYDVDYALGTAWRIASGASFFTTLVLYVGASFIKYKFPALIFEWLAISALIVVLLFIVIFIKVWRANQPAVVFEFGKLGLVSFCAQDMENTLLDYLLLRQFRNSWQRRVISVSDIFRIDNEIFYVTAKRRIKYFSINISGKFGSQKIVFSNKQKRDECRALFSVILKRYAKSARMDSNLSVGSSEDSGY